MSVLHRRKNCKIFMNERKCVLIASWWKWEKDRRQFGLLVGSQVGFIIWKWKRQRLFKRINYNSRNWLFSHMCFLLIVCLRVVYIRWMIKAAFHLSACTKSLSLVLHFNKMHGVPPHHVGELFTVSAASWIMRLGQQDLIMGLITS